jgi:hypothetical protein
MYNETMKEIGVDLFSHLQKLLGKEEKFRKFEANKPRTLFTGQPKLSSETNWRTDREVLWEGKKQAEDKRQRKHGRNF